MFFVAVRYVGWCCMLHLCPGLFAASACGGYPEVKAGGPLFSYGIVNGLVGLVR